MKSTRILMHQTFGLNDTAFLDLVIAKSYYHMFCFARLSPTTAFMRTHAGNLRNAP
jgi:hypothetical protein